MKPTLPLILIAAALLTMPCSGQRRQDAHEGDPWDLIREKHDKNGDGKVTEREYSRGKERFQRLDTDGNKKITSADFIKSSRKGDRNGRRRGNKRRNRRLERAIQARAPKQGDAAPDFTLKHLDGKSKVRLSSFRGKRPVALIFGSYT